MDAGKKTRAFFARKEGFIALIVFHVLLFSSVFYLFLQDRALAYETPLTPQEYLYASCTESCDAPLLDAIASCESQWRMVKNATSSAYGYFQILDSTERTTPQYAEGRRKFDPYANVDMAVWLYETRGSNPWNESRGCWYWKYRINAAKTPRTCIGIGCEG